GARRREGRAAGHRWLRAAEQRSVGARVAAADLGDLCAIEAAVASRAELAVRAALEVGARVTGHHDADGEVAAERQHGDVVATESPVDAQALLEIRDVREGVERVERPVDNDRNLALDHEVDSGVEFLAGRQIYGLAILLLLVIAARRRIRRLVLRGFEA